MQGACLQLSGHATEFPIKSVFSACSKFIAWASAVRVTLCPRLNRGQHARVQLHGLQSQTIKLSRRPDHATEFQTVAESLHYCGHTHNAADGRDATCNIEKVMQEARSQCTARCRACQPSMANSQRSRKNVSVVVPFVMQQFQRLESPRRPSIPEKGQNGQARKGETQRCRKPM